jgi:hypothetical protein
VTCLKCPPLRVVSSSLRRFTALLAVCVVSSWTAEVYAATVAILSTAGPSRDVSEAIYRLRGELASLKLDVLLLRRPGSGEPGGSDARAWLERAAQARGIDAALEVIGETAPDAVDVWTFQRAPWRAQVTRVELEPDTPNRAGALAIRAVEVLRSFILQADLAAKGRKREEEPPTASPLAETDRATASRDRETPSVAKESELADGSSARAGIELGVGILTGLDGVGPALLPMLRAGWRARPWVVVQATVSGLGTEPELRASAGTVRVVQDQGSLGVCYCPLSSQVLAPYVALAAGVARTSLYGEAASPARGHAVEHWSLLLDAGAGARLRLAGRFYSTLTGHVQLAQPHVAIHIVNQQIASTGRPNLAANLALGAWL